MYISIYKYIYIHTHTYMKKREEGLDSLECHYLQAISYAKRTAE